MSVSIAVAEEPRVLHALPGRVRVHLPGWTGQGKRSIEKQLRQVWGVQRVQTNPLTSNILVQFDWTITNEQAIIDLVRAIEIDIVNPPDKEPPRPHMLREQSDGTVRARIAVRGLDRDPHVAQRVIAHLEHRPGIRATVNQLTGRILIECKEHEEDLEELLCEIADLELPELPGEDHPTHPLDPGPLIQSAVRTLGASLGLALHAGRQLLQSEGPLPGGSFA
ncbi:MAG: HMA2 domain-containing protein, partial [Ktedonobacteraceae bacterium]